MPDIRSVANNADMIVNGYAFTRDESGHIRILNLNSPSTASVIDQDGKVLETSMDDLELSIVLDYYKENKEFIGAADA